MSVAPYGPGSVAGAGPSAGALLTLLDRAIDVIAVVDAGGDLVYLNSTVTDVLQWPPADLIGRPALGLIHPDDLDIAAVALAVELTGSEDGPPVEVRIRNRAGDYLWFEVLASGWIDAPGVEGLVLNLRESTGRHELAALAAWRAEIDRLVFDVSRRALDATLADIKEALPAILAQLGMLLRAHHAYTVLFDDDRGLATNVASWAMGDRADAHPPGAVMALDELPTMLSQLAAGELLVVGDLHRRPPPWTGEWYVDQTSAAGACVICPLVVGGRLLGVLAIEQDHDAREWLHDELNAVRSVGEALAVAHARDQDRRALMASEEHFRLIAANASDAITLFSDDGLCHYASAAARAVLGMDPAELVGTNTFDHVHADDQEAAQARLAAFSASRDESIAITYRWRRPSGEIVWIENVCRAVRDPETGALSGIQGSARDMTRRKAREDELSHRALHDPLTGVANRTLFVERLATALRRRRDTGSGLAVLAIDLDGFKDVNDAFGHLDGDRALVIVAERLNAAVRQSDTVGRFGGDEFLVLCLDTTADDAAALARRLVEAVAEPIPVAGGTAALGASVGVAPADTGFPSLEALLSAADQAMYEAKRAGKRGVRLRRPG